MNWSQTMTQILSETLFLDEINNNRCSPTNTALYPRHIWDCFLGILNLGTLHPWVRTRIRLSRTAMTQKRLQLSNSLQCSRNYIHFPLSGHTSQEKRLCRLRFHKIFLKWLIPQQLLNHCVCTVSWDSLFRKCWFARMLLWLDTVDLSNIFHNL